MTKKTANFYQLEIFARRILGRRRGKIARHDLLECYLKEIRKHPVLTKEEEFALTRRIRDDNDGDALHSLISSNLKFVVHIARRYADRGLDLIELIDAGNLGLIHAVKKYDERRSLRLNTYSIWWIRRAIHEALKQHESFARVGKLAEKIKQTNTKFVRKHGRKPTEDELSGILKTDPHAISVAITELRSPCSLEDISERREELLQKVQDIMESDEDWHIDPFLHHFEGYDDLMTDSPEKTQLKREKQRIFHAAFGRLQSREKEVLERTFGLGDYEPHTLAEISRLMNITRERVRQIKENALVHLRGHIEKMRFTRKTAHPAGDK